MPEKKRKKVEVARIYVGRAELRGAMKLLTESQKSTIAANTIRALPDDYELFPSDELKEVLSAASVEWRDTKIKPKVPVAAEPQSA